MRRVVLALLLSFAFHSAVQAQSPDAASAVDSVAQAAVSAGRLAGATVLVAKGHAVSFEHNYGLADLDLDVATPTDAIYSIGSLTKQFTAVAVMRLVEQGKVNLDDDASKYIGPFTSAGPPVTVRRLLDHTSGVVGYTELPIFGSLLRLDIPQDSIVAIIRAQPRHFAPGDAMVYSNSGFFLLGVLIEHASGMSYEDFLSSELFSRAHMNDTHMCDPEIVVKHRMHGYVASGGQLLNAQFSDPSWPFAAGGICSTAKDLLSWTLALHSGQILSAAGYKELLRHGQLRDGTELRYAKGLFVDTIAGQPSVWHNGASSGFNAYLAFFPRDSTIIIALTNTSGPVTATTLATAAANAIYSPAPRVAIDVKHRLSDYVGEYRGVGRGAPTLLHVTTNGATLFIANGAGAALPAVPIADDEFERGASKYYFRRRDGRVVELMADLVTTFVPLARTEPEAPKKSAHSAMELTKRR